LFLGELTRREIGHIFINSASSRRGSFLGGCAEAKTYILLALTIIATQ